MHSIFFGNNLSSLLLPFQLQDIQTTKQMNKTQWSTEERKCIHPQTFSSFSCTLPFIKGVVLFVMVWITQSTYKINLQQSTNASSGYQAKIRAQQNTQMNKRNTCQQKTRKLHKVGFHLEFTTCLSRYHLLLGTCYLQRSVLLQL